MATKKKTKKPAKAKKPSSKKKPVKKPTTPKKVAKKKAAVKKAVPKKRTAKKIIARPARKKSQRADVAEFSPEATASRSRSGGQSGDLQGLSDRERADSESVDELLEEGNAFEADVVKGVEDAGDDGEVHTHEVPEDDVPGEYLDED
jgi:hypothetical protein